MRRHAQRIDTAMDTAVAAAEQAKETERRAAAAAVGTAARYHPVTVANRIQKLTADRNRITRLLDGHVRTLAAPGRRHPAHRNHRPGHRAVPGPTELSRV